MNDLNPINTLCRFIGPSTCTQVSNIASNNIVEIALSAIGLGLLSGYIIYNKWYPTRSVTISAVAPQTAPPPEEIPIFIGLKKTLTILEKSDDSIIYELPSGKPNPRQECKSGYEQRERVMQSAQKGFTCWYYASNYLRDRIGKYPSQHFVREREKEKICSEYRKALTRLSNVLPVDMKLIGSPEFERTYECIELRHKGTMQPDCPKIAAFLEEFFNDTSGRFKNANQFAIYKVCSLEDPLHLDLLKKLNWDTRLIPIPMNCPPHKRTLILSIVAKLAIDCAYGLQTSSWAPKEGIDHLIKELKKKAH